MVKPATVSDMAVILDYGSQYTQLIARRCRELGVYSEIHSHRTTAAQLAALQPTAVILSGGPASVYEKGAPAIDPKILDATSPVLGICYGMQLGAQTLGGKVVKAPAREYGNTALDILAPSPLFSGLEGKITVWMSHGDQVEILPPGAKTIAHTTSSPIAAFAAPTGKFYGIQFHPEVAHTPQGTTILGNFLFKICGCKGDWNMAAFISQTVPHIRQQIGKDKVVLGLSGGVDSAVTAVLIHRAVGDQLTCIFVDNGLLRAGEFDEVQQIFRDHFRIPLVAVPAGEKFLGALQGVTDPEQKRKIIGRVFIEVFRAEAAKLQGVRFLAQGTIYPDVIESKPPNAGPSETIKSHHNVGGLPEELGFELVEPLRDLFKDEVREVGKLAGLSDALLYRHPFPGPGLAIRIIGEVTAPRLQVVRKADTIILEEIVNSGLYRKLWQVFGVLLPVSSVGVMGDARTYENTLAIRAVTSLDAMTADWAYLPEDLMRRLSNRIINEVRGINRVVYDISSKPPATIEWE